MVPSLLVTTSPTHTQPTPSVSLTLSPCFALALSSLAVLLVKCSQVEMRRGDRKLTGSHIYLWVTEVCLKILCTQGTNHTRWNFTLDKILSRFLPTVRLPRTLFSSRVGAKHLVGFKDRCHGAVNTLECYANICGLVWKCTCDFLSLEMFY